MSVLMRSGLGRAVSVLGGSGLVAAGVLVAAAGPASAQVTPPCGSNLIASVTLTANMNCTSDTAGDALTIGAAGVTVNLNGHSILGPGLPAGTTGINDTNSGNGGYSDVTVENGTISGFYFGVDIEGSSGSDLTGVTVRHIWVNTSAPQPGEPESGSLGVVGAYLSGATIQKVTATDFTDDINLGNSQDSTITGDRAVDSQQYGIFEYEGASDTISGNTVVHPSEVGIEAEDSAGGVIQGNTVTKFCEFGIQSAGSGGVSVTGNKLSNCYTAISDNGNTGDTFSGNTGSDDLWGIYGYESTDETYTGNTFSGGQYGIETDFPTGETLTGNTTDGNSEAGIFVYTNGESGYAATLSGDTANHNRYGLYSQIATAGSGNHAAHNKVVNCYNVTCAHSPEAGPDVAAPPHHQALAPLAPPARF